MNILLIGGGGREHTLAWKLVQSPNCTTLHVAPGNAGTAQIAHNVHLDMSDFSAVVDHIHKHSIEMVVIGPEAPLVAGISDYCHEHVPHVQIVGPSKKAAQLEGSKAFSKVFMQDYGIPTAAYVEITQDNLSEGYQHIDTHQGPYVLKADGLAAGKGVLIIEDPVEAKAELADMLDGKFGAASETVVIEEFLSGIEFSMFVYVSDQGHLILPEAKDYKRIGEGDTGLNTGGMGAISPVPFVDEEMLSKVHERIIQPTLDGLADRQIEYRGFIFIGLISVDGEPYVIEYNCRLGDPETEVVIPRVQNDLVDLLQGRVSQSELKVDPRTATTVMMVSQGYPEAYQKGKVMTISSSNTQDSILFHAGTKQVGQDIVTNGGRVMAVTSLANDMSEAIEKSMKRINTVKFDGKYFRRDIGFDL